MGGSLEKAVVQLLMFWPSKEINLAHLVKFQKKISCNHFCYSKKSLSSHKIHLHQLEEPLEMLHQEALRNNKQEAASIDLAVSIIFTLNIFQNMWK